MFKKIMKVLYFLFIIFITFIVISLGEVKKNEKFLEKNTVNNKQDNYSLIQSLNIVKTNKNKKAYTYIEPLYKEYIEKKDDELELEYEFDLVIYRYLDVHKKKSNSSIAIIVENLNIYNEDAKKDDEVNYSIDIDIGFDDNIVKSKNKPFTTFIYPNKTFVLLIDYEGLKNNNNYVNIKDIDLKYQLNNDKFLPLISLRNSELSDKTIEDDLGDFNREINVIHSENVVKKDVDINNIKNDDNYIYDKELLKKYRRNNIYIVTHVLIELLFVVPITYFIFFHKDVLLILKQRKIRKREEIERMKEEIRKKEEVD